MHRTVTALKSIFQAKSQSIDLEVEGIALPVIGDRTRLLQVAENLLTNASRYTQRGGKIVVRTKAVNGQAQLSVEDNGSGIAQEQIDSIFEMFKRGESNRGTQAGLGVGLALSKMLIERHGGKLAAKSPGLKLGATFLISLPFVLDTSAAERQIASNLRRQPVSEGKVFTIVLIEDDDDARTTLRKLLELDGHTVIAAATGKEGIAAVNEYNPDVTLVDLSMPDMNGIDVVNHLRQNVPRLRTKFIAVTGHGQQKDRLRTEQAGFAGHLIKPVDLNSLAEMLRTLDLQ